MVGTPDGRRCVQRAYLYVTRVGGFGDPPYADDVLDRMAFDPDQVTELVGLQPTRAHRRGDPHPTLPGGRRFSTWNYGLPAEETPLTEDVMIRLLDAVEHVADRLAHTCRTLELRAGITVVIEMESNQDAAGETNVTTSAITYSADTIQRLARLNLSIDHDQYVLI